MASEADTRHGPLGILLAQARAEKITYTTTDRAQSFRVPSFGTRRKVRAFVRISKVALF